MNPAIMQALQGIGIGQRQTQAPAPAAPEPTAPIAPSNPTEILSDKKSMLSDENESGEADLKKQVGYLPANQHCETCVHYDGQQCEKYGFMVADEDGCVQGYSPVDGVTIGDETEEGETPEDEAMEHEAGAEEATEEATDEEDME